jgi:hypothetical protein
LGGKQQIVDQIQEAIIIMIDSFMFGNPLLFFPPHGRLNLVPRFPWPNTAHFQTLGWDLVTALAGNLVCLVVSIPNQTKDLLDGCFSIHIELLPTLHSFVYE